MAKTTHRYGYIRVSSITQNTERQLADIVCDKIFTDKVSGKSLDRPALQNLLSQLRPGDTLVTHSMDRLARNVDHLRQLVAELISKEVKIEFVKERLTLSSDDSPMNTLILSVMGSFAEFERALIRERQLEGIAIAKKAGKYRGRKPALSALQITDLKKQIIGGKSKSAVAKAFHISRETLYKYLKK